MSPLRLSRKNSTPASTWKSGNAAPGKSELVAPLAALLDPNPQSLPGPSTSCGFLVSGLLVSPLPSAGVVSEARARVGSQPFCVSVSCLMRGSWLGSAAGGAAELRVAVPPGVTLSARCASLICRAGFAYRASVASVPLAFSPA